MFLLLYWIKICTHLLTLALLLCSPDAFLSEECLSHRQHLGFCGGQTLRIHYRLLQCFAFRRIKTEITSLLLLMHHSVLIQCSDVHLKCVAFYDPLRFHWFMVNRKNTNPFSELHSLSPSLRFLPLLKPPVPLGAANVSDIDPSSGSVYY